MVHVTDSASGGRGIATFVVRLLLRTTCHGLIMWDEVMPTTDWVIAQIPEVLLDCLDQLTGTNISYFRLQTLLVGVGV